MWCVSRRSGNIPWRSAEISLGRPQQYGRIRSNNNQSLVTSLRPGVSFLLCPNSSCPKGERHQGALIVFDNYCKQFLLGDKLSDRLSSGTTKWSEVTRVRKTTIPHKNTTRHCESVPSLVTFAKIEVSVPSTQEQCACLHALIRSKVH